MAKYRKKPVVVEAVQWTGENWTEMSEFMGFFPFVVGESEPCICIDVLDGRMYANIGEYIIKDVNGEFYPCNPKIFEKTYERVEEE